MFENLRRAFKTSKEMWNFAGYWSEVVSEYHKITGWNLEQVAKVSNGQTLLDDFCQRAMKRGMTARECAVAIYEQGFTQPDVLHQSNSDGMKEKDEDISLQGPFDKRNPLLAPVFHAFKDEAENKNDGYSVSQANHPQFIEVVENGYKEYSGKFASNDVTHEQIFNEIVDSCMHMLLSCEPKLAGSPDMHRAGISVALVAVLRVLFGSGPAYADATRADASLTTLGILAKVLTKYRSHFPDNAITDFGEGAIWAISEFLRRCQAKYAPPHADVTKAQEAQRQLAEQFAEHGLDYMGLHPTIHQALLNEVTVFGRAERTVEMFLETVNLVQKKAVSDEERAQMLLEVWRARGEMYR